MVGVMAEQALPLTGNAVAAQVRCVERNAARGQRLAKFGIACAVFAHAVDQQQRSARRLVRAPLIDLEGNTVAGWQGKGAHGARSAE